MPASRPTPGKPPPTVAEALAAKLARLEWLHADNQADRFPSFAARLRRGEAGEAADQVLGTALGLRVDQRLLRQLVEGFQRALRLAGLDRRQRVVVRHDLAAAGNFEGQADRALAGPEALNGGENFLGRPFDRDGCGNRGRRLPGRVHVAPPVALSPRRYSTPPVQPEY